VPIVEPIKIEGLKPFSRGLRKADKDLPKVLRVANNQGADIVAVTTRRIMRKRSGRGARSVKTSSTRTAAKVSEGGGKAKHVPWLDFGGRVGRRHSVKRPYIQGGRYLYPSWERKRPEVLAGLQESLRAAFRSAGLDVG
jgi:hypothetical protein